MYLPEKIDRYRQVHCQNSPKKRANRNSKTRISTMTTLASVLDLFYEHENSPEHRTKTHASLASMLKEDSYVDKKMDSQESLSKFGWGVNPKPRILMSNVKV